MNRYVIAQVLGAAGIVAAFAVMFGWAGGLLSGGITVLFGATAAEMLELEVKSDDDEMEVPDGPGTTD